MAQDDRRQDDRRRDQAARAAWLYFMRGRTQDDIAEQLAVSRQAAQRLVALAVSERLITFRLDHPLAACLELGAALAERHGLAFCDVAPADPDAPGSAEGVAQCAADRMAALLSGRDPVTLCVGTGRTLRAAVDHVPPMRRPEHRIVSLVGAMSSGGSASPYDVVMRFADRVGAQRHPLPCPVVADTPQERAALQSQRAFAAIRALRETAAASFLGIGAIGPKAPMLADGFLSHADVAALQDDGAVGEVAGWPFDAAGRLVAGAVTDRIASLPLEVPPRRLTVLVGCGPDKTAAIAAALAGGLATALVTDEATAAALLA